MRRRRWPYIALAVLALGGLCYLGLVLLDGRACAPDDRRCLEVDRLLRIEELLELSPLLRWRQRPYLDATFEGTRVATDRRGFRVVEPDRIDEGRGDEPTIVAYGASPDFGYGVEARDAWPAVVHDLVERSGAAVRVVNAGEIGYSSLQGRQLFDVTKRLFPIDVAIFSYVVNDVEQIRFFFPDGRDDRSSVRAGRVAVRVQNALASFAPFSALRRVVTRYAARSVGVAGARRLLDHAMTRTLPEDYEANLRGLAQRARKAGIQPVFLVLPFKLPVVVPPAPAGVDVVLDAGEAALASGDPRSALREAHRAIALDDLSRRAWRLRGLALEALDRHDEADAAFVEATKHILHDCVRSASVYNDIMRRVAAQTGTPLVDAAPLLGGDAANMELYVRGDYVHPNARGHRLIGEAVAMAVGPLLRSRAEQPLRGE